MTDSAVAERLTDLELNRQLLKAGASKTVYALVTPETEATKEALFGDSGSTARNEYYEMFRDAWTGKQADEHGYFFAVWHDWSRPVIDLNRNNFPWFYPSAGASEAIRHLIYGLKARHPDAVIHFFEGEYEGYRMIAEACRLSTRVHARAEWHAAHRVMGDNDLFFISQPSAIDGNVWHDFNAFVGTMPKNSVVADVTYVGAVPKSAIRERFDLNARSIFGVVFSLSKPFGVYYDRIGGVYLREEDPGLYGNMWFKNMTSLRLGTMLLENHDVFALPNKYAEVQKQALADVNKRLSLNLEASDVFILAGAPAEANGDAMAEHVQRGDRYRVCLTPTMAEMIGTAGPRA